jgi:hypothetical protein
LGRQPADKQKGPANASPGTFGGASRAEARIAEDNLAHQAPDYKSNVGIHCTEACQKE